MRVGPRHISKKQHYLRCLVTFVPCGCLANSIVSLDKAGQDKFFIPLMSSPWQAPQAPTRRCKTRCKPQSKYTPWPVSCFGRCITSWLLHHILATALHLASRIAHHASHRASRVAPHFLHRALCLISRTTHRASFPASHLHLISCIARRALLSALHLASHIAPHLLHHTSPPCVATAPSYSSSIAPASEETCNCRLLHMQELIDNVSSLGA